MAGRRFLSESYAASLDEINYPTRIWASLDAYALMSWGGAFVRRMPAQRKMVRTFKTPAAAFIMLGR